MLYWRWGSNRSRQALLHQRVCFSIVCDASLKSQFLKIYYSCEFGRVTENFLIQLHNWNSCFAIEWVLELGISCSLNLWVRVIIFLRMLCEVPRYSKIWKLFVPLYSWLHFDAKYWWMFMFYPFYMSFGLNSLFHSSSISHTITKYYLSKF